MTPPVFSHGSLRLYLLSLLAEQPRHGYELIQALSDRFGGTYSPSAGTIYPRLAKLEEEGLVTKTSDGRKSVYRITEAGRAELAARENELSAIEDELTDSIRRLADGVRANVNEAMRSLRADLASAAREAKRSGRTERSHTSTDERANTDRRTLADIELALNEFRRQLRTDVRSHAARSTLSPEVASMLKIRLDEVRSEVLAALAHQ